MPRGARATPSPRQSGVEPPHSKGAVYNCGMAWYDVGAILLGVVCAVACLIPLGALLVLVYLCANLWWPWRKPPKPPVEFITALGTFFKDGNDGEWELHDERVDVTVHDLEGTPDPAFLARLPALLADLPRLEAIARAGYDFEVPDVPLECEPFALHGLEQGDGESIVLDFSSEGDECDLGTVFVTLLDDKVVGAVLVH